MVNQTNSYRQMILQMLRDSTKPLSGQRLSEKLGVSRTAVWKQIKALKELGYDIESGPTGYVISDTMNHLYAWEFDKVKENYKAYALVDSTMDIARNEAAKGADNFTTILAEQQKKGKGRGDKSWVSSKGGLYFTWIIKPQWPLAYYSTYTYCAASAIAQSVEDLCGIPLSTKWPNDLLSGDKKVAGILSEMETHGDSIKWLNLGIGINVNNNTELARSQSLKELTGSEIDRRELLETVEKTMKDLLKEKNPYEIHRFWESKSSTINQRVSLRNAFGENISGRALTIDSAGSLVVETGNKTKKQALFGDLYIQ